MIAGGELKFDWRRNKDGTIEVLSSTHSAPVMDIWLIKDHFAGVDQAEKEQVSMATSVCAALNGNVIIAPSIQDFVWYPDDVQQDTYFADTYFGEMCVEYFGERKKWCWEAHPFCESRDGFDGFQSASVDCFNWYKNYIIGAISNTNGA